MTESNAKLKSENSDKIFDYPSKPESSELESAHNLINYGIESVNQLWNAYKKITKQRGKGAPLHTDQDILRAMLVMSGAALDASIKSIVKDSLHEVIKVNEKARDRVKSQIHTLFLKKIQEKREGEAIAEALISNHPDEMLIDQIIEYATGGSLQSIDQLCSISDLFGIDKPANINDFKNTFQARNQIIHEMDAVDDKYRRRRQRKKDDMKRHAIKLLEVSCWFVEQVDVCLKKR
ncbi:MAG: hypothetical protein EPO11_07610 [Gammaproteobacteria bacterium]|nr:MAG: hypothetical protein EPO11_07610 [Gammaproteobacteria bacterium]